MSGIGIQKNFDPITNITNIIANYTNITGKCFFYQWIFVADFVKWRNCKTTKTQKYEFESENVLKSSRQ